MPIFAKNITVGGKKSPTVTEPKPPSVNTAGAKTFEEVKRQAKRNKPVKKVEPPPQEIHKKYIHKEDGELVRQINTKSQYLKDIFEDFS